MVLWYVFSMVQTRPKWLFISDNETTYPAHKKQCSQSLCRGYFLSTQIPILGTISLMVILCAKFAPKLQNEIQH